MFCGNAATGKTTLKIPARQVVIHRFTRPASDKKFIWLNVLLELESSYRVPALAIGIGFFPKIAAEKREPDPGSRHNERRNYE